MPSVPPWSAARRGVATPPWRAPVSPARRSPQPRACYRVMVAERGFVGLTTFGWRSRLGSPIPPCWLLTPEPQPAVALCRKQQRRVGLPHIVGIVELDPGVRPQVRQPREQLDSRQPRAEAGAGTGSERKVDGRVSQASRPQPAIRIEDLRLGPPPRIAMQQSKADHQPIARRERPLAQAGRAQDVSQQQPDRRMQAKCLLHHRGEVGKIAARGHLGLDAIAHLWPPGDFLDRPCGRDARAPERRWVWLLCRDWLTWEVVDLAGWVATLPRGCRVEGSDGPRARGHWKRRDEAARVRVDGLPGQERPDSAQRITTAAMPISAILRSTGSFSPPTLRRLPATRSLSAGWWCLPAVGQDRSGPHAPRPVEQRHPDPPPTASFPGQAVPTDELHPAEIARLVGIRHELTQLAADCAAGACPDSVWPCEAGFIQAGREVTTT